MVSGGDGGGGSGKWRGGGGETVYLPGTIGGPFAERDALAWPSPSSLGRTAFASAVTPLRRLPGFPTR